MSAAAGDNSNAGPNRLTQEALERLMLSDKPRMKDLERLSLDWTNVCELVIYSILPDASRLVSVVRHPSGDPLQVDLKGSDPRVEAFQNQQVTLIRERGRTDAGVDCPVARLMVPVACGDILAGLLEVKVSSHTPLDLSRLEAQVCALAAQAGPVLMRLNPVKQRLPVGYRLFAPAVVDGLISHDALIRAVEAADCNGQAVIDHVCSQLPVGFDEIDRCIQDHYGMPLARYDPKVVPTAALLKELLPRELKQQGWVPLGEKPDSVQVAITKPRDTDLMDAICGRYGPKAVDFRIACPRTVEQYVDRYYDEQTESLEDILASMEFEEIDSDAEKTPSAAAQKSAGETLAVMMVDKLISAAVQANATALHVEPSLNGSSGKARLRIDGRCRPLIRMPAKQISGVVLRLKVLAQLDISERRLPQKGRFQYSADGGHSGWARLSTLPAGAGVEAAVVVFEGRGLPQDFESWNFTRHAKLCLRSMLRRNSGLFVACADDSRTDTAALLHGLLQVVPRTGRKIWSLEPGQDTRGARAAYDGVVAVNPRIGLDPTRVLRALADADPDVILLGRLFDREAADLALNLALDRCLVLATMPVGRTVAGLQRLVDMGLAGHLVAEAFSGAVAVRRSRRLCNHCRQERTVDAEKIKHWLPAGRSPQPSVAISSPKPGGCRRCRGQGYLGQVSACELLLSSKPLQRAVVAGDRHANLVRAARRGGMISFFEDALQMLLQGVISPKQFLILVRSKA